MSDERGDTVDLAYIGRALQRLINEVASLRDDMGVLTGIVLRHERTLDHHEDFLRDMLRQITAMVRQHQRIVDRLRATEERGDTAEDRIREIDEKMRAIDQRLAVLEDKS